MNKAILKSIVVATATIAICYGLAMFVTWGKPFSEWDLLGRAFFGAFTIVYTGIASVASYTFFNNK